jgi:hypothetical protein
MNGCGHVSKAFHREPAAACSDRAIVIPNNGCNAVNPGRCWTGNRQATLFVIDTHNIAYPLLHSIDHHQPKNQDGWNHILLPCTKAGTRFGIT